MWPSRSLTLFHGTDDRSIAATNIGRPIAPNTSLPRFAVSLSRCKPLTDFGQGFYTTTSLHQAREWANTRTRRLSRSGSAQAVVLRFVVDLDRLAALESLVFVRASADYWSFVGGCRGGATPHGRPGPVQAFDVVFGPVTIWPQRLLISDCDQISFHTAKPSLSWEARSCTRSDNCLRGSFHDVGREVEHGRYDRFPDRQRSRAALGG